MAAREEAEKQLIAKASKDPKFKESLVRDPRKVISKEFGVEIPADISVKVLEETAHSIYVVLPAPPPAVEGGALSDTELESVAAGAMKPKPTPAPACSSGFMSTCHFPGPGPGSSTGACDSIQGSDC